MTGRRRRSPRRNRGGYPAVSPSPSLPFGNGCCETEEKEEKISKLDILNKKNGIQKRRGKTPREVRLEPLEGLDILEILYDSNGSVHIRILDFGIDSFDFMLYFLPSLVQDRHVDMSIRSRH